VNPEPLVEVEGLALRPGARSLSFSVLPGQGWAVVGSRQSSVDKLCEALRGVAAPPKGTVARRASPPAGLAERRRGTLGTAFKKLDGVAAARSLTALGLWSELDRDLSSFDAESRAAVRTAYALALPGPVLWLDRGLDMLGPKRFRGCLDLMAELFEDGFAAVGPTCRPEVAEAWGHAVVLQGEEPVFAGPVSSLLGKARPAEIVVETDEPSAVAAMAEPFALRVVVRPGELALQAADGQALAARLLTEGYGKIRAVVVRTPTLEDALADLL
jgi:hypothetical protein